ncbi:hypothetical protein BHE74_00047059 [Ensete ventricosum]|nr:hypothetical protein BHE74_00047059 [Ensete ventricosum]
MRWYLAGSSLGDSKKESRGSLGTRREIVGKKTGGLAARLPEVAGVCGKETKQQLLCFDCCEREERAQESAPTTKSGSGASLAEEHAGDAEVSQAIEGIDRLRKKRRS